MEVFKCEFLLLMGVEINNLIIIHASHCNIQIFVDICRFQYIIFQQTYINLSLICWYFIFSPTSRITRSIFSELDGKGTLYSQSLQNAIKMQTFTNVVVANRYTTLFVREKRLVHCFVLFYARFWVATAMSGIFHSLRSMAGAKPGKSLLLKDRRCIGIA